MNKLIIFGLLFITTFIIIIISYFMYFREKEKEKLFYTTNDCPEMKIIEDNWQTIAKEIPFFDIENIEKMKKRSRLAWNNNEGEKLAKNMKSEWIKGWQTDSKWFNFPLMYHGKVIDKSDIICPKTIEILKKIPSIQIVGYSILLPKSKLDVHTDEAGKKNNSMAYNLLLTDSCANLYVKNEKNKHKLGKAVIFDSNNEHYADNEDNKIRVILYVEFRTDTIIGTKQKGIGQASTLGYPTVNIKFGRYIKCGMYTGDSNNGEVIVIVLKNNNAECHYKKYDKKNDIDKNVYIWNLKEIKAEENSIIDIFNKGCLEKMA